MGSESRIGIDFAEVYRDSDLCECALLEPAASGSGQEACCVPGRPGCLDHRLCAVSAWQPSTASRPRHLHCLCAWEPSAGVQYSGFHVEHTVRPPTASHHAALLARQPGCSGRRRHKGLPV